MARSIIVISFSWSGAFNKVYSNSGCSSSSIWKTNLRRFIRSSASRYILRVFSLNLLSISFCKAITSSMSGLGVGGSNFGGGGGKGSEMGFAFNWIGDSGFGGNSDGFGKGTGGGGSIGLFTTGNFYRVASFVSTVN